MLKKISKELISGKDIFQGASLRSSSSHVLLIVCLISATAVVGIHKVHAGGLPPDSGTSFVETGAFASFERNNGERFGGLAWLDYDADGDLDMISTNGIGLSSGLFRNDGAGVFTDVTQASGLISLSGNSGVVAGDIDNDGYPDVFMSGEGNFVGPMQSPAKLFHNNGDGTFTDITATANIPPGATALSAAMADINNDGYLDLFITAEGHLGTIFPPARQDTDRLFLNNGDLTFTDISESAGMAGLGSCANTFSDYDNDGWLDLFVAVCNDVTLAPTPFHLFRNNHDNTFTDVAAEAGLAGGGFWMSVSLGDIDNDGDFDLFSTNFGPVDPRNIGFGVNNAHALYRNNGDGTYTDIADETLGLNQFAWGSSFADFDNDGFVDLFFAGALPPVGLVGPGPFGNPGHLFMNDRHSGFVQDDTALNIDLSADFVTGVARADFDGNGFPDIAVSRSVYLFPNPVTGVETGSGEPVLLSNNGNTNHWLTVQLIGEQSNRMGIGAKIEAITPYAHQLREVRAGSSFLSSETPWPTFGLGRAHHALIKVSWPSGLSEWFFGHHGQTLQLHEGHGAFPSNR
ncbi:ASPIC/UnbV domain protein [hydrothermal vent metagenome]|uniref:ASPIC/UnbV domain protein n=1 Tax=hydrothermal vent metagenome TaxID=652676 RepID=A0A3B0X8N6_9ZZZZ